ncbi:MAG: low molecular weight phosphotyrosine protein phosphatase [Cyclobacteriaceae bacterium]|nr:low molecular weight phosphotyrosine protein phosphatase [Cyclobacteriaceae bacterium]MCH8517439.1 low molecular weight phosphotyrosine protein phosphatase [Cyclobacteriaceae bacterium]
MTERKTISVMFVCLGNICRSPLAHFIFETLVSKKQLKEYIKIESSGTAGYHIGEKADERSIAVAKAHGVEVKHRAKQLKASDLQKFDYVLPMDQSNYKDIMGLTSRPIKAEIIKMRCFEFSSQPITNENSLDVPDPYYGNEDGFEEIYQLLEKCCVNLLDYILKEKNIAND